MKHQKPRVIEGKYGRRKVFRISVNSKDYDFTVNERSPLYRVLVRKLAEAFNKHDLALLDEFYAPDCVDHTRQLRGLEQVKQYINVLFKGSSDIHGTIEDIIAEEDKVLARVKATGTHTGEYQGIAPTGKKMIVRSVDIWRIVNGKLVEGWTDFNFYRDDLNFFKQLGLIEYTEKGKKLFPQDNS